MKQDFYDYDYFVGGKKGGAGVFDSDAIVITQRFKKWGVKEFFDMGCGIGCLIGEARREGIDAYGCDFSEYSLEWSDPEAKPYMFLQDITKPIKEEIAGKKFDWVILYGVLEHIETEDQVKVAMKNALNLLKPDGKIHCLICERIRHDEVSHHFLKTRDWWLEFFCSYKLHDISKHYYEGMGEENIPRIAREELFVLERIK